MVYGMVVTMDAAGRLVIPSDIRREAAAARTTRSSLSAPVAPGRRHCWRWTRVTSIRPRQASQSSVRR